MDSPMYDASVPVFDAMLANLSALLDKAAAHAAARNFDVAVLLQARLFPDMLPLVKQVQIACDGAKFGVARLTGTTPPKDADDETTIDQLKARIQRTRDFIKGVPASAFEGAATRRVEVPVRTATYAFHGRDFLLRWALPNFYFHLTTAYALLRHNGVEIGKRDFLGQVPVLQ